MIDGELAALLDPSTLNEELHRVLCGAKTEEVVVGIAKGDRCAIAAAGVSKSGYDVRRASMFAGCLSKILTATIAEKLLVGGELNYDDEVAECLGMSGAEGWRGLAIKHLFEHTHGLDDSSSAQLASGTFGRISTSRLLRVFSGFRINHPGEIYSYSHAGAWILAAIVERRFGGTFAEILGSELGSLLEVNGFVRNEPAGRVLISPATGMELRVTVRGMLNFLLAASKRKGFWPLHCDDPRITRFPGWNPFELGVYRSWKVIDDMWYGHSSHNSDGSSSLIRVNPSSNVAIVVYSKFLKASLLAARLLGSSTPGARHMSIPQSWNSSGPTGWLRHAGSGRYRNGATVVALIARPDGSFELEGEGFRLPLTQAEGHILIAAGGEAHGIGFVQGILESEGAHDYRYIWDGRRIYRNIRAT